MSVSRKFRPDPYPYHHELELEIERLTNLGQGIGRDDGWVVQVPFALPGERIRARVFRNYANYSEADLLEVLRPSPQRQEPVCPLFGTCGGCQYQHLSYEAQLKWKREQVAEVMQRIGGLDHTVEPTHPSPQTLGYRSKLTPHYPRPRKNDEQLLPIGFLQAARRQVVDVPQCPIATDAINTALPQARKELRERAAKLKRGGTLLLRHTLEGVVTDPREIVSERIGKRVFQFHAGDFFQNNPFILPQLVDYVRKQALAAPTPYLVDAYCGVGVFALSLAEDYERVAGVEINAQAIRWANGNAKINSLTNTEFLIGEAEAIFATLKFPGAETTMIIDPPRAGCDELFRQQLMAFAPARLVYISCDPSTQARDLAHFISGGYLVEKIQPFDLFPQTRHIECVATLRRA